MIGIVLVFSLAAMAELYLIWADLWAGTMSIGQWLGLATTILAMSVMSYATTAIRRANR